MSGPSDDSLHPKDLETRTGASHPASDLQTNPRHNLQDTPFASFPLADMGDVVAPPGYEIQKELARGGMGVVYAAADAAFGRAVAVKVLLPGWQASSAAVSRFRTEARITGRLQHPGIPPVHAHGTLPDGRPYLVMKLIEGRTLAALLDQRPEPTHQQPRFLQVFEQVCQAVGYAHGQGVIHRDLKPANVMVGAFGEVQVMDWGLGKEMPGEAGGAATGIIRIEERLLLRIPKFPTRTRTAPLQDRSSVHCRTCRPSRLAGNSTGSMRDPMCSPSAGFCVRS